MCATTTTGAPLRWRRLYAIFLVGFVLTAGCPMLLPHDGWRIAAMTVLAVSTVIGVLQWLGAHRAALDLAQWCECAAATVRVRVVHGPGGAPPPWQPRQLRPGLAVLTNAPLPSSPRPGGMCDGQADVWASVNDATLFARFSK